MFHPRNVDWENRVAYRYIQQEKGLHWKLFMYKKIIKILKI